MSRQKPKKDKSKQKPKPKQQNKKPENNKATESQDVDNVPDVEAFEKLDLKDTSKKLKQYEATVTCSKLENDLLNDENEKLKEELRKLKDKYKQKQIKTRESARERLHKQIAMKKGMRCAVPNVGKKGEDADNAQKEDCCSAEGVCSK